VLDLLGLPPLGVPRLDLAPTAASLTDSSARVSWSKGMASPFSRV
jgi:hypothetical protein